MKNNRMELSQRICYALIAGMAGAFLIPQVAFAAPTGGSVVGGSAEATITQSGNTTNIAPAGTNQNKVIQWKDYSVAHGEHVIYDGGAHTNNYLNIVTGANTSNINGKIIGGNHVYIVNPNGVIFGKNAEVNVGHLHVSTQAISTVNTAADMANNVSPLGTSVGLSDVVNMGKDITANTVEVHGKNVRFLNAANVHTTASPVVLHTDTTNGGYAHIGYKSGNVPAVTAYQVNGGNATPADNYYQLVADKTEFQNINSDRTKNYMLENDIDFSGTALTPIGDDTTKFTGKLDGNFFQVKNFNVSGVSRAGLFGATSGARLENFGVVGAHITGMTGSSDYAGGIAAYTTGGTQIRNVYVKDTVVDGRTAKHGGIVGVTDNTTLDGVYSKATIGAGGGIIGTSATGTNIYNTYSDASFLSRIPSTQKMFFIYMIDPDDGTYVENSFAIGQFSYNEGNLTGNISKNTFKVDKSSGQATLVGSGTGGGSMTSVDSYSGWGSSINNTGAPGAKWRIYEGRTMPLLTAFMSGTATATYNYRYFKSDGTLKDDTGNTVKSNDGKDITAAYNSYYMKVVDRNSPDVVGDKGNVTFGAGADTSGVLAYVKPAPNITTTLNDFDKKNGVRDVGTKAILWSDQDGPNLSGVNVTITPRTVGLNDGTINPTRMYNGKSDVTKAFKDALTSGSVTSSGFTSEDIAAETVRLDFDSGNFKAQMVDGSTPTRNVGTHDVKFSGTIGFTGSDAGNYIFDGTSISSLTGKATITKAPLYLNITKKTADDKTYNGKNDVIDTAMRQTTGTPNISLDKSKAGLTLAQINAGTPTMPDGAIMSNDSDVPDDVDLGRISDPTYTNLHAGDRKLQYTGATLTGTTAGNYELFYTPASGTKTAVTDGSVYLDGKIVPREILRNAFDVYKTVTDPITHVTTQVKVGATKIYDGNRAYTPTSGTYLSSNAAASGDTGIVERDQGHITFALTGGAKFTTTDGTETKNVANATRVAYNVTGVSDDEDVYKRSDYYIKVGTVDTPLTNTFAVTGAGKITPKTITAAVKVDPITKVYNALTAYDKTGDDIITLSGLVSGDTVTNTSTAEYDNKNVGTNKNVTYTAQFLATNTDEAQNYTFAAQADPTTSTPVTLTKTLAGKGNITVRPITLTFNPVTKTYDGTTNVDHAKISVASYGSDEDRAVITRDFGATPTIPSTITGTYDTRHANTGKTVTYTAPANALGSNYTVTAEEGTGTINRRLIESSGFQVRKSDGTTDIASRVYNGTTAFTMDGTEELVAKTAASGSETGVVDIDKDNIYFELAGEAHFLKGTTGNERTSHVSEAERVGYSVAAHTHDGTNSPLTNYEFGTTAAKRSLETVDGTHAEDAVTATGRIRPKTLTATTKYIDKRYDGMAEHTDGNRNIKRGSSIVELATLITDVNDAQPTNTSTARYADENVAYDTHGNVTTKFVTYTAQLTGKYADDYEIVDGTNKSTVNGSGANKTVTLANFKTDAAGGKITRRKLKVTMGAVEKTYDNSAKNTTSNITGFTDDPASTVLSTILSRDNIDASALQTTYNNMLTMPTPTATSTYGRGTGSAFAPDANASNNTPHDVQYTNLDGAFKKAFASHEKNYEVEGIAYGKGTIKRFTIDGSNANQVTFAMKDATKVYDGTQTVKYKESADPAQVRNYINTATLHLDGGGTMEIGGGFTAASGTYDTTADVNGGRRQGVTYQLTYTGGNLSSNIAIASGTVFKGTGFGVITPKTVTATVKGSLEKIYDGTPTAMGVAADTKGSVVSQGAHIVKIDGLVAGATNASTAVFTSKDAGEGNRAVKYTVGIDAAHAGNYKIVDASNNAVTTITTNNNTITKRKVDLTFAPVSKDYDGTSENTQKTATVSANDATVLARDKNSIVSGTALQNITWGTSAYGTGTTDAAFKADPNAGAKSVRYKDTGASMRTALGDAAKNYEFADNSYGTGTIKKAKINAADLDFAADLAKKVYDGQKTVKKDGSAAKNDVKKYITKAEATVNGKTIKLINDLDLDMQNTQYTSPNATNGTEVDVDYVFKLSNRNVEVAGGNSFTLKGKGTIDRRVLTLKLAEDKNIDKDYDRTTGLVDTTTRHYTKFTDDDARGNVTYAAGAATKNENKLVRTANGAGVDDGAQMTITANYADRNVVRGSDGKPTAQDITYNVQIAGTIGKNYTLSDGTTKVNAEEGLTTLKAKGTINPRKLQLNFENPNPRPYDTTAENKEIILPAGKEVTPLGMDAEKGKKLLEEDQLDWSKFDQTQIKSFYGRKHTADDGFDKDGSVGAKDLIYENLANTLPETYRNNYEVVDKAYGQGVIEKAKIAAGSFLFNGVTAPITKEYDGETTLKYTDPRTGVESQNTDDVRKYFANGTLTINPGTRYQKTIPITENDIDVDARYQSPDVVDSHRGVDYTISLSTKNFQLDHVVKKTGHTEGAITPLDLTTQLPKYLYKQYDAEEDFNGANQDFVAAQTREGLINGLVKRDDGNDEDYLDYAVQGHYHTADATIADKKAADANVAKLKRGESITAGTQVDYKLSFKAKDFSSDPVKAAEAAKRAKNYTIFGTHATAGEAKDKDADIYRKTLKLTMGRIDKEYDGSDRTITSPDITIDPGTFARTDRFVFNDAAAGKITGTYDGTDVKRAADGTVLDRIVTYTDFDKALEELAKTESKAKNYRIDDQQGVGKILPRRITHDELKAGLTFTLATKEYDGTDAVVHKSGDVKSYLNNAHVNVTVGSETKRFALDKRLISVQSAKYDSPNVRSDKAKRVTYVLSYDNRQGNFELTGGTSLTAEDLGTITSRKIYAEVRGLNPTKTYNKSEGIVGEAYNGGIRPISEADLQNHVTYRHYVETDTGHTYDGNVFADSDKTKLRTNMSAEFANPNVAWKDDKWRNEKQGDAKDVTYTFSMAGDAAAENYEFVDANGNALENKMNGTTRSAQMTRADGRIDPYRIELHADSRELRAGEGLPSVFAGTPNGSNYKTPLGDRLSGTIRYTAPTAQTRWGDYPIMGSYEPASENEFVYKNYFFDAIPGILHVSYHAPDYEYYKALTQTSKMLPDEYAYEHASLDYRSHYGRDATAEIAYTPPSINMVKDGTDLSKTEIRITDESVFSLVSEVFGA